MLSALTSFAALATVATAKSWVKDETDVDAIILGVSFPTPSVGFIAGGSNGAGPFVKTSTDSGQTWTATQLIGTPDLMFLDVAMQTATNGVASGLSIGKSGNAFTTDGKSFTHSKGVALLNACQSVETMGKNGYGLTGQFGAAQLAISNDGGASFKYLKVGDPNIPARYGAFPDESTWYVASGAWPASNQTSFDANSYDLTKFIKVHLDEEGTPTHHSFMPRGEQPNEAGWITVIYKTTDAGQTFNEVFRDEGNFYPNEISCWDANTCQFVVEGDGASYDGAAAFATTDGGATWNKVYEQLGASMSASKMTGPQEGWVAGAIAKSQFDVTGQFIHTTDGWASAPEVDVLKGVFPVDLDFTTNGEGYSVVMLPSQQCSLAHYA